MTPRPPSFVTTMAIKRQSCPLLSVVVFLVVWSALWTSDDDGRQESGWSRNQDDKRVNEGQEGWSPIYRSRVAKRG